MTQYHVTHTTVVDDIDLADRLSQLYLVHVKDFLWQPGVTHVSSSITDVSDHPENSTRDRLEAIISYLGEELAMKYLLGHVLDPTTQGETNA